MHHTFVHLRLHGLVAAATVLAGRVVAGAASDDVLCAFDEFSEVNPVVEKILFMLGCSKE